MENWKDIIGYEGLYMVSDLGNIKTLKREYFTGEYYSKRVIHEHLLVPALDQKGYLRIGLSKNSKNTTHKVHRIVAIAFIENKSNKPQVNHKNGIKSDNRALNLEWADNSDNQIHAFKHGLNVARKGENHSMSKLCEADVLKIRGMYISGNTQTEISKIYNVTQANISEIVTKKSWSHI